MSKKNKKGLLLDLFSCYTLCILESGFSMKHNGIQREYRLLEEEDKKGGLFLWIILILLFIGVSISTYAFYLLNSNVPSPIDPSCKVNCDVDNDGKVDKNIDYHGDNVPRFEVDKIGDGKNNINRIDILDNSGKCIRNCTCNSSSGVPKTNIDFNNDGIPNLNLDTNDDCIPEINIDTNKDGKADINIDTDGDGIPDTNITEGNSDKPSKNVDYYGDGIPTFNVEDENGNITNPINKPGENGTILNQDTNNDGYPDINIDIDNDGYADLFIDTNNDGKPDLNIDMDKDRKPDINIDTNGDLVCDENCDRINITDNSGKCIRNCDTNNDGIPDLNIVDENDVCIGNCDTNNDGVPDMNLTPNDNLVCVSNCSINYGGIANIDEMVFTHYGKVIESVAVEPGWKNNTILSVSNNTSEYISYEIKYTNIRNEFTPANDLYYELREDGILKNKGLMPYSDEVIKVIKIPPKFTYRYNLTLEFIDKPDENQNVDAGKTLIASVEVNLLD